MRVSKSGGWMSAVRPHLNRVMRRSWQPSSFCGGLSEVMTICFPCWSRCSRMWKISSCVRYIFPRVCTSSSSSTSFCWYFLRMGSVFFALMATVSSLKKLSTFR